MTTFKNIGTGTQNQYCFVHLFFCHAFIGNLFPSVLLCLHYSYNLFTILQRYGVIMFVKKWSTITTSIAAVILLVFLTGCQNDEVTKDKHLQKAMIYIKDAKEKEAIIELRNAIQIDPKFAEARYQLGLLYLKDNKPRQAFAELQRAATLDPDNLDAKIKTAEFYLLGRQKEEARINLNDVLAKAPDNKDGLALLANLELMDGNRSAALEAINKAIEMSPEEDRFYSIKGRILASDKQFALAEQSFVKALELNKEKLGNFVTLVSFYSSQDELDKAAGVLKEMAAAFPDSPQPYLQMASLSLRQNEVEQTEQHLLKAMEIAPDNAGLKVSVADFFSKRGNKEKAEALYKEAIEKSDTPENVKARLANFYFDNKRFDDAKALMDEVLGTNPKNGGAKLVQAKFYLNEGKPREALDIASALVGDYPEWGEVYFVKAIAHGNLKEPDLAKNALLEAISKTPGHAKAHSMLALLLLQEGSFEEAKKEAAIALKIDSKNFQAAMLLAKGVLFSKEFENAEKMFSELDTKVPNNPEILGNLGLAYLGLKQPQKAQQAFEKIMEIQPGNAKAFTFLLKLSQEAGKDKDALIDMARQQIDKAPDSAELHILFANLMLSSNQPEKALEAYKIAQELDPQNPRPYAMSALILNKQGKTEQAITEYKDLLAKQPDAIGAYMGLGAIYEQTGRADLAKEEYMKALKINQNFAPAANNLAWMIADGPDPDLGEALRLAMTAKQELPNNPNIIDTLGWVHYKRKSFSLARNEFAQAVEKDEKNPILRYHLALALYGEEKRAEAIKEMQKVVASKQDFKEKSVAQGLLKEWQQ